jgi:hypothetical protein
MPTVRLGPSENTKVSSPTTVTTRAAAVRALRQVTTTRRSIGAPM